MNTPQIVEILETIARILEIQDENPFKVRAYRNGARALESLTTDLRTLVEQKKLGEIPGIGKALEEKITQLLTTGTMDFYEELRKEVPAGVLEMLAIPSFGPKKARVVWKELGVTTLDDLRQAALEHKLASLKGFGEKTEKKILEGIAFLQKHAGQYLLSDALPVARRLVRQLQAHPTVQRVSIAGSLRRWKEVVKDIDLLASSDDPPAVMNHFIQAEGVAEVLGKGETKTSVRMASGMQVDLRVVSDAQFPYALAYFTGSKEHNVVLRQLAQKKGLKINEYEITDGSKTIECKDEAAIYQVLGLPYVPPELRENTGELDRPPATQLIDFKSLKGVFHTHSTWSDGTAEIEAMAEKARSMGLSYMGLSDHSKAAAYANGLDEARLTKQMTEIDRLNQRWKGFRILKGLECDILPDGTLDLTPEILSRLDFVIGSVHSRFDMSERDMTDRVCKAIANEHFDILGHPTGRLLLSREGYRIDLGRVLETAKKHEKIVELNAYPNRLDLDWIHCRRAKELGVMLAINPDAHSTDDLENIEYGIATARRAWLEEKDVINTRGLDEVLEILNA
ncbi:MAG TPA: DNA polymerase/3'-5' exonuclease PolX [Planctomycetota bacterium]|nr:DNA polymerase/3'-5' exonuclease PolX [Planctomycetota bacterium]